MMKKIWVAVLALGLVVGFAGRAFAGQSDQNASDKTPSNYDIKGQVLVDLQDLQKKFTSLAGAVPQDKYGWRPAEGVRSIGEVYLHVTQANYGFIKLLGGTPAVDFTTKDFEKSTTEKAKIVEQMNTSFEYARTFIDKMTNADIQAAMKQFGPDANKGDVIYLLADHAHEHLGQSIAYARVAGIIPPWTVEAMKKQAAKDKEKAPQE
jgi:uncharacterized damage-inducible protein DinB